MLTAAMGAGLTGTAAASLPVSTTSVVLYQPVYIPVFLSAPTTPANTTTSRLIDHLIPSKRVKRSPVRAGAGVIRGWTTRGTGPGRAGTVRTHGVGRAPGRRGQRNPMNRSNRQQAKDKYDSSVRASARGKQTPSAPPLSASVESVVSEWKNLPKGAGSKATNTWGKRLGSTAKAGDYN